MDLYKLIMNSQLFIMSFIFIYWNGITNFIQFNLFRKKNNTKHKNLSILIKGGEFTVVYDTRIYGATILRREKELIWDLYLIQNK